MKTFKVLKKRAATLALACVLAISAMPVFAGTAVEKPSADVKPGMYRQTKQVALSAQNGAKIYYTTNNLMPTENDTEYTSPITVSADTNICAIAVKDGVKSSAATFGYLIRTEEQPKMQFVVMSDIHIGDGLNVEGGGENVYDLDKARTFKAVEVMSNIFSNPDLMVINGDLIKHNNGYPSKEADHATFIKLIKDSMKQYGMENTPVQVTIGNHDSQGNDVSAMKAYYDADETAKDWFPGENGYYHKEVNGLDFIYIDSNHNTAEQKAFLSDTLAQIKESKGESSPIFVFLHIPIAGTLDDDSWTCSADWKTILADYPQAIVFSGHTHYSVTEDCSISQEAGFTAVNDGSMSYIEKIDTAKEMVWNSTDGTQKKTYQFPVTQGLAVEVYDDRVEINRITVNGDRGDVKVNNYVAAEPFDNCGAYAGEKWTIKIGSTADEWKDNFTYTKSQRRANDAAPEFAEGTQPAISGSGRTATVSFPQTVNPRNTDKYAIELVNSNTGKTEKTVKVWSENVFTPMPEKLEYTVDGLNPGTTYYAKVTAYNVYGAASAPAISADTFTTEEIPGRKPQVIAQQYFSEIPTDEDNATTIVPYVENYKSGGVLGEGVMDFSDGNAKWVSNNLGGTNLMMPFNIGTTVADGKHTPKLLDGEFMYEFDLTRLSAVNGQNLGFYLRNGSANVAKLTIASGTIKGEYYYKNSSGKATLAVYGSKSVSGTAHTIRLRLGTENGTQYISGLWVDGKEVSTAKQLISDYPSDGWKVIAAGPEISWVTGDMCSVDNISVWRPIDVQLKEVIAQGNDSVSFDEIKGENTSADSVTKNLALSELVGTQTPSGLVITGWTSDNENIVSADGTVTRPAFSGSEAQVTISPILGMADTMGESDSDYVTASGDGITVTVPDMGVEPLTIAKTGYISDEDFSGEITDESYLTSAIPYVYNYTSGGLKGTGTMSFADGNAKWVSNNKGGTNLMIPFNIGTTVSDGEYTPKNLGGEFYYELELTRLSAVSSQNLNIYLRNGGGTNLARLVVGNSSIKYEYYSAKSTFSTYASASVSGSTHKIKLMLGSDGTTQYIGGLWIDGKEISTKKQSITIASNADSWKLMAVEPASSWVTGDMCSVDNVKVWRSAENQAKELAAAEDGKISFEQIKGENASADAVTANLELKAGEEAALQTANKMLVVGWKSDKPDVVDENGIVTRQVYDTEVALTPVLAIIDSDSGAYVTADGAAIGVIVKRVKAAFTDADGKIVSSLDGTITKAVADVSDLGENAVVAAGLYSGNKLENVWIGEKGSGYADVALDGELEGKTLKLFVWEDGTWKPLGEAVEL